MLTSQVAYTLEIDDTEAAVEEILAQLDLGALKTNTIGLVSALTEYVQSGVIAALQEALPFLVVGQTSIATASPGSSDLDQLSLLVLTADDVRFDACLTEVITGEDTAPLENAYTQLAQGLPKEPALVLTYGPLLMTASGDFFVSATNTASGDVPLFGALAVDGTINYRDSQVIYQGQGYLDRLAYVLISGNVHPHYYLAGISHGKIINETGVVTASVGNQLQTINNEPVSEFLINKGISRNEEGEFLAINSFPYVVDYNDGTDPVIRVMFAVTPEGAAVCGGDIPVGATLGVSYFDKDEIMKGSSETIQQMADDFAQDKPGALLAFSCIGRYFTLGFNTSAEADLLHKALDEKGVPYTFTYCGGEISPVHRKDGNGTANRAHNSTFIAVAL